MTDFEFFTSPQRPYERSRLRRSRLGCNPLVLFRQWLTKAIEVDDLDAHSTTLATADSRGHPSARIVLLKQADQDGFVFFTNYESRKARELEVNPFAALVFYWPKVQRQVRVEGWVERVTERESNAYFESRPRESRIAALVSPQSTVIESHETIEGSYRKLKKLPGPERPLHWGGFRLRPKAMEFWQGGDNRLHDRFLFTLQDDNAWKIERLAP